MPSKKEQEVENELIGMKERYSEKEKLRKRDWYKETYVESERWGENKREHHMN